MTPLPKVIFFLMAIKKTKAGQFDSKLENILNNPDSKRIHFKTISQELTFIKWAGYF